MENLAAFYFSGTGNTRFIAERLCKKLTPRYRTALYDVAAAVDASDAIRGADVLLFAFPVYGSAPPIPMRRFVHRYGELFRGKRMLIAETQYFFSGDGAAALGRTLKKYGGEIVGAEQFNMPNNLADCKIFSVKNGEEIKKTIRRAEKRADRFANRILRGKKARRGFGLPAHAVGYLCQRRFWWKGEAEKRKKLRIDAARCVGCGLCAKRCPVQNIEVRDGKAVPRGNCVLCYRCVNLCPRQAIALFGASPPETQYHGPNA